MHRAAYFATASAAGRQLRTVQSAFHEPKKAAVRNAAPGDGDSMGSTARHLVPGGLSSSVYLPHSLWCRIGRDLFELVKKLLVGRGDPFFG